MESEILSFYKDKTVFITGGTGFLGKVIIEKLLRVTDVERIYFLVRTKRGEGVKERFEAWKKDQIFKVLLEDRPQAMEHVTPIAGDCSEVDLGISEGDRRILTTEVQVIIHGAASVRFMEPLQDALNINTRSVRLMVQLAKEMRRLEAFLHISTAFSNCVVTHTQERFYPEHLTCSSDKVLELNESLSTELVNKMAPALLGRFPNTYTYTKALGEQVIQEEAADLPVGIFRPAIIFSIFKEPLPGWVDGLQGIGGMIYGSAYGILHLVLINGKANASVVPADYCVNVAIATPVQIAKKASQAKKSVPPIFTFAPCQSNEITYNEIIEQCYINAMPVPNTKMIWYPFTHRTNCPWLFSVGIYLYHMLPALLLDMVLRLKGKKPVMIKTYHKVHEGVRLLYPFSKQSFTMETNNTDQLWQSMTPTDKRIFHFDMANLSWVDYFSASMYGMRLYLFKDLPTPESVAKGKRILNRYYLWDRTIKFVLFVLLGTFIWYLFKLAFN